jgi:outer membrane protein insertion porin family
MKYLKEDEKLLSKQTIKAPKHIDREQIRNLFAKKTNRTLLGTGIKPLVPLYYGVFGLKSYDQEKFIRKRDSAEKKFNNKINSTTNQKKINNLQFRKQKKIDKLNSFIENGNHAMQWGEPIAVFDSASVITTEERISYYLFANGYFKNKVTSEIQYRFLANRVVEVNYILEPGRPYLIDSILFDIPDSTIVQILRENIDQTLLKRGNRYKQDDLTKERERIDLLLKDYGYYDFSRQYIEFEADTINENVNERLVSVKLIIHEPERRGHHQQFRIDSIRFVTDASLNKPDRVRRSRTYRDISFNFYDDNYNVKILSQRVFFRPGEYYSRTKTMNTQRQLANLDAFKFININMDTTGGKFIANVFSSPLPRYEWTNEAGVNVTQGFPGPFYSVAFRKRNIFKGLENFELSGRFGFEGVASATQEQNIYKSTEAGVNASIIFPQFIFPLREKTEIRFAQYNPKTKFTLGYAFTDRPEYRRTSITLNDTYTWQNNRRLSFSFTPLSVGVIDTANLSPDFRQLLAEQFQQGNYSLYNSFSPSFVNSMSFSITWNQNNYGNLERSSSFVRGQIESGGTIWNFVDPKIITDLELQYYKYIRLGLDGRRITVINQHTTLAYRLNGGFAWSYGENKSLPYEKFFFAGGSNSIRAWRPRRLGPGSFKPDESTDPKADGLFSYKVEKPAEILIEGSIELRKKLFGFVSGAVFVDAGNVWTFTQRYKTITDENGQTQKIENGNSQFTFRTFRREIAIGTGFGLRFDFTFLILRLDVGMKMYDPARDQGSRFVLDQVKFWSPYARETGENTYDNYKEPVIYNVGIGYSF